MGSNSTIKSIQHSTKLTLMHYNVIIITSYIHAVHINNSEIKTRCITRLKSFAIDKCTQSMSEYLDSIVGMVSYKSKAICINCYSIWSNELALCFSLCTK